jgi:hypothetical protein
VPTGLADGLEVGVLYRRLRRWAWRRMRPVTRASLALGPPYRAVWTRIRLLVPL